MSQGLQMKLRKIEIGVFLVIAVAVEALVHLRRALPMTFEYAMIAIIVFLFMAIPVQILVRLRRALPTTFTYTRIVIGAFLAIAVAIYAFLLFGDYTSFAHKGGATCSEMRYVFKALCDDRGKNGRWPGRLDAVQLNKDWEAHGRCECYTTDPIFDEPWLYYPDAKPGTRDILLAQAETLDMKLWPFSLWHHRFVLRADGEWDDIGGEQPR